MIALAGYTWSGCTKIGRDATAPKKRRLALAVDGLTALAKRHFVKAIDVLKRARDYKRSVNHLLSEAHFNLGEAMLIRLAALPEG